MNARMTLVLSNKEEFWTVLIAVLVAVILAAHQVTPFASFGLLGSYLYWIPRILIETGFFIAVLYAVKKYLWHLLPSWLGYALSIILSLVPFTLAITAFDLIVGLPELGLNNGAEIPSSNLGAFALELFYLLDNHAALCVLLLLPQILNARKTVDVEPLVALPAEGKIDTDLDFLRAQEPPLSGQICTIEAQEHYIRVTTTVETRMVLYRFSDAVRQIPSAHGMQVHRSHWVAHFAVESILLEGQSMKLKLQGGGMVPVSRTFRTAVEGQYPLRSQGSAHS